MAPLSPLPPFQVPLPLPLLLPLSPVPVRDRPPANVLVVLCACRSVGNKLSPLSVQVAVGIERSAGDQLRTTRINQVLFHILVEKKLTLTYNCMETIGSHG
jgi:hypothetical protein